MLLPDVNVLVYAHRADAREHERYLTFVEGLVNGREAYGVADMVLSGFVRVVTHPRIFDPPSPLDAALEFAEQLRDQANAIVIAPGRRHWDIFTTLCHEADAKGNLVADAWLAALAIESGSEWVTTDRDFARFRGLRWRHPLGG
jgi:toxin-antitoxin system PIN domain toxin